MIINSFTIISFATSIKCYHTELLSIDRADIIVDWLKSIKPSGCTSMLDAIKVTHLKVLPWLHVITDLVSCNDIWSRSYFISNRWQPGSEELYRICI